MPSNLIEWAHVKQVIGPFKFEPITSFTDENIIYVQMDIKPNYFLFQYLSLYHSIPPFY